MEIYYTLYTEIKQVLLYIAPENCADVCFVPFSLKEPVPTKALTKTTDFILTSTKNTSLDLLFDLE